MLSLLCSLLACDPPDCDRADHGTCGNACCKLSIHLNKVVTTTIAAALNTSLSEGGPDGRFRLMPTHANPHGFADLRPYHISRSGGREVHFLGQAWHETEKHTYNDTVNLLVMSLGKGTILEAFSISQVGGAYGDDGQNFKNIAVLVKGLKKLGYGEAELSAIVSEAEHEGCPPPAGESALWAAAPRSSAGVVLGALVPSVFAPAAGLVLLGLYAGARAAAKRDAARREGEAGLRAAGVPMAMR